MNNNCENLVKFGKGVSITAQTKVNVINMFNRLTDEFSDKSDIKWVSKEINVTFHMHYKTVKLIIKKGLKGVTHPKLKRNTHKKYTFIERDFDWNRIN